MKQCGQLPSDPRGSSKTDTSQKKRKVTTSFSANLIEILENVQENIPKNVVALSNLLPNSPSHFALFAQNMEQEKRQGITFPFEDPNLVEVLKDFDGLVNAIPIFLRDKRFKSGILIDRQVALVTPSQAQFYA